MDKKKNDESAYRCGKHGFFSPAFDREIDGQICPRIMCLQCEEESMDSDSSKHPRNVPYYYDGELKVVLQEGHWLSAVWQFDPPVIYPDFTFAEDLSPVISEDALTSEEVMSKMEALLPELNMLAAGSPAEASDLLLAADDPNSLIEQARRLLDANTGSS